MRRNRKIPLHPFHRKPLPDVDCPLTEEAHDFKRWAMEEMTTYDLMYALGEIDWCRKRQENG